MNIFRKQAQAFDKFCKGDDKLMAWLAPIVNILFNFSETLGEGLPFSHAKTVFAGIGVLLGAVRDVIASYEALSKLFERIQFFPQRLPHYTSVPLTQGMTELLAKIMAQILSILALSTKAMKDWRIKANGRTFEAAHHVNNKVTVIEEVLQQVDGDIRGIQEGTRNVDDNVKVAKHGNLSRERLRIWLTPPNPSIDHNTAHNTQHDGTANWFIHGPTFNEWKANGSLLWIHGNPGSGKSILCSAVIEEIKHIRKSRSALIAYYYFDFKDAAKRDTCRNGSEQPSEPELAQCLCGMLDLPGLPTYIIIDALDECPNNTETPSARETVLNFVKDLVQSKYSNLYVCITSHPEQDINAALIPLTPPSRRVSLHEEGGQIKDISTFVHSFVMNDSAVRRWGAEEKELVILRLVSPIFHQQSISCVSAASTGIAQSSRRITRFGRLGICLSN
ncbi:hypothetical protein BGY98DRAFT_71094 [Russula aff. rugulosa BPL654]|nr:hypothetical protein BGY98DRAFT_71094 [Russula aff. rugulosa BPL654]